MGKHDSSRTRAAPVFKQLLSRDPTGMTWLPQLLSLPRIPGGYGPPDPLIAHPQPLIAYKWHPREKQLDPPRSLLEWLVQNGPLLRPRFLGKSAITVAKRRAILQGDRRIVNEALAYLSQPKSHSNPWYILEGSTKPDVYLETPEVVVVIEGKRTERRPELRTEWMPHRHQMLRHMDCAWEVRGQRTVLGFFIVEGQSGADAVAVPAHWQRAAYATITPGALDDSLPHRTTSERQAIVAGFLGVTTWQQLCVALQIDYAVLPDVA